MGNRALVALLNASWCIVMVEWFFLAVPWGCLRFVIVVFPDHAHLLFVWSRGQISNFKFCCITKEEKPGYYFQSGTCLGTIETHGLLCFLWSIFCKWPVTNVTLLTLEIAAQKYQTNDIFYNSINEIIEH